jgi:hypothetical protein
MEFFLHGEAEKRRSTEINYLRKSADSAGNKTISKYHGDTEGMEEHGEEVKKKSVTKDGF